MTPRPGFGTAGALALALLTSAAHADSSRVHSELERVGGAALTGYTLESEDDGFSSYEIRPKGRAVFRAAMGAHGTGTWAVTRRGLRASGRAKGGPCDGAECGKSWRWQVELTDIARSKSGLIVLSMGGRWPRDPGSRRVFDCDEERRCEEVTGAPVVGILAGSKERALHDAVAARLGAALGWISVAGAPARHQREVSEVWWVPRDPDAERTGVAVARALAPIIGEVEPKKWTFGASPYDVIVVTGHRPAGAPAPAPAPEPEPEPERKKE